MYLKDMDNQLFFPLRTKIDSKGGIGVLDFKFANERVILLVPDFASITKKSINQYFDNAHIKWLHRSALPVA